MVKLLKKKKKINNFFVCLLRDRRLRDVHTSYLVTKMTKGQKCNSFS